MEVQNVRKKNERHLVVRFINILTNVLLIAMILIRFDLEVIMGRKSGRAALVLTDKQRSRLSELAATSSYLRRHR